MFSNSPAHPAFMWVLDSSGRDGSDFEDGEGKLRFRSYQRVIAARHTYVASGQEGAGQAVT